MRLTRTKITTLLYLLVIVSSVSFFNPMQVIPSGVGKLISYAFFFLALLFSFFWGRKIQLPKIAKIAYSVLMIVLCLSVITTTFIQDQNITTSLITTFPFIAGYGFFFIMMRFAIPKKTIIFCTQILLITSVLVYLLNFLAQPQQLFGDIREDIDMSRGIARLWIPFIELFVLMFFYFLDRYKTTLKAKYLTWLSLTLLMVVLSVTRQIIILCFALGTMMILSGKKLWQKCIICLLIVVCALTILPKVSFVQEIVSLSVDQIESHEAGKTDIRLLAWAFYCVEMQSNSVTPVIGNGVPAYGKSAYGNYCKDMAEMTKCYAEDVGWAGFFYYFGIIATGSLLILLLSALVHHKKKQNKYLNYWLTFLIITSVASGPILYYWQIISLSTILYLVFGQDGELNLKKNAVLCDNYPKL